MLLKLLSTNQEQHFGSQKKFNICTVTKEFQRKVIEPVEGRTYFGKMNCDGKLQESQQKARLPIVRRGPVLAQLVLY